MDLFDVILAKKMSGGSGGGGGSSDFSTVALSVTLDGTGAAGNDGELIGIIYNHLGVLPASMYKSGNYTLVMYNDEPIVGEFSTGAPITVYGGAIELSEYEQDGDVYYTEFTITGDCSVTLTAVPNGEPQ